MIHVVVGALGGRREEQVPVHVRGDRFRGGPGDDVRGLLPVLERAIGPDVDLLDQAQVPAADDLGTAAEARIGRPLVAHLGAHLLLTGGLAHQPGLIDRVGQRLLAVHVLAHPHGRHGRDGVRVVGRRDDHGIQPRAQLVEQLAEVVVLLGLLVLLGLGVQPLLVDVAERDDPAVVGRLVRVAAPLAAHPDAGDVQGLVRPDAPRPAPTPLREDAETRDRRPEQERSAVHGHAHLLNSRPVCARAIGAAPMAGRRRPPPHSRPTSGRLRAPGPVLHPAFEGDHPAFEGDHPHVV